MIGAMVQFRWDAEKYLELMHTEVPDYDRLQDATAAATRPLDARTILELGTGTGETARRILAAHPHARLIGLDSSQDMLTAARQTLDPDRVDLRHQAIEGSLPEGPFDLVVSTLAVHHLEGEAKADLFARVHSVLRPAGRFVLADVVVPERSEDALTPIDPDFDFPATTAEQLGWLEAAGFSASVRWRHRDLRVLLADRSRAGAARGTFR